VPHVQLVLRSAVLMPCVGSADVIPGQRLPLPCCPPPAAARTCACRGAHAQLTGTPLWRRWCRKGAVHLSSCAVCAHTRQQVKHGRWWRCYAPAGGGSPRPRRWQAAWRPWRSPARGAQRAFDARLPAHRGAQLARALLVHVVLKFGGRHGAGQIESAAVASDIRRQSNLSPNCAAASVWRLRARSGRTAESNCSCGGCGGCG
jgi:hypothetical protein